MMSFNPLRPRRFAFAVPCLVALATSPACKKEKSDGDEGGASTGKTTEPDTRPEPTVKSLTVYSGRSEKLVGPALAAFEKEAGIKLAVKYAGTAELAAALLDEGSGSPADVFIAQDASTLGFLESKDRFAALAAATLARAPETFRSKTGKWVGVSGRARVLAYNTKAVDRADLPATAAALTDAKWKGKVGWAPENASFQSAVAAMVQLEGEQATREWLEAMRANAPKAYPKNTPAVVAVSRGEIDVALVNHYYLYRLKAEYGDDFPVANHYFRSGKAHSMVNLSGAAVVSTTKKKLAAEKLIAFLLSDAGQRFFVEKNHEFPVAAGVASPDGLPAIETLEAPALDLASLRDLKTTHELLRAAKVLP